MMNNQPAPQSRQSDIVVQELKGELLIYDLKTNKAFCLNETSAFVWQQCDGKSSAANITDRLSRQLKRSVPEDMVWLALDQLKADDLLDSDDGITNGSSSESIAAHFNGLSRREVIRRVGISTLVALPLISSLIAPTAVMAQSGGACVGTQSAITCGAATDTGFSGTCGECLANLPSCCTGQIVAAPACTPVSTGCTSCTRTCA